MSGIYSNLTTEQKLILREFRQKVSDVLKQEHDDRFLLRWLRARKFDIGKAEAMLRKSLLWRKQLGIDFLLTHYDVPEIVVKYVPTALLGFDKEGNAVRLYPQAVMDHKGFCASVPKHDVVKSVALTYEYDLHMMRTRNKKNGKHAEKFVFIIDYDGFSLMQVANKQFMDVIVELTRAFESNYPECLKTAFFINVPPLFSTLYSVIKPLLAEETRAKFKIFGRDGWKEEILKEVDSSTIPAYLGGSRVDSDGNIRCPSHMNAGGLIPEKYHIRNNFPASLSECADAHHVAIEYHSSHSVHIHVVHPDSVIRWDVETDGDLSIGLFRLRSGDELRQLTHNVEEVILPTERKNCQTWPDVGTYYCEQSGIYQLRIENAHSMYRKSVTYRTQVVVREKSNSGLKSLDKFNWTIQKPVSKSIIGLE